MVYEEKYYKNIKETIYYSVHKSGLKVFVMPKEGFTKSYAILATAYGSVNNRFTAPGDNFVTEIPDGIAHYLEHKMFDQEDGTNVFDRFAKYGANANAFTSFTSTAYLFSASSFFYENLETLLDYTSHPYYTDESVLKEQGIIGQEIKMYEDDPDWNVFFNALKAMYKENPVNIDIAGTVESISKITKEKLYKCYNTFYHPSNMVLFCTGAVSPEKVAQCVDRLILSERKNEEIINHFPDEPSDVNKKVIKSYYDIGTPSFVIAYKDSLLPEKGEIYSILDAEMSVLCEIIGGKGSRLYNELYEKNLINDSFSCYYEGELCYAFTAFSGESENPEKVYELIKDEITRLKNEGIDKDLFERAKRVCLGRAISLFDKQESFSNTFVRFALKDSDLMTYPDKINNISLSSVLSRLKQLDNEKCVLSAVYPKGSDKK